jgi:hypothetical protein
MGVVPEPFVVKYHFIFDSGSERDFTVQLDPTTLQDTSPQPNPPPDWAKLDYQKCPNCPLRSEDVPYCPAATSLSSVVPAFADIHSFEKADIRVEVSGRVITSRTDVQTGLGSLLGLQLAASGCPVLAKLRPMVRFHLPFATQEETIFRATAMYLVGQYLRAQAGEVPDWSLVGLADIYRAVGIVNRAFALRLRAAGKKDANLNAVIVLDCFAKAMPEVVAAPLKEFQYLFQQWR